MKNKILFCIKTTRRYQNRIDSIIETWLSGIDDYIFYSDHEDSEKNVILSSHDSSYLGCLHKTIWTLNNLKNIYLSEETILDYYDWICVVDDDTFVNTKKLDEYVETLDNQSVYGHLFTSTKNPENPIWTSFKPGHEYVYHSGGAGVLFPSKIFSSVKFKECGTVWDDVTVGVILGRNNIPLVHSDLFSPETPEYYDKTDEDVVNMVTYHHINPERMKLMYDIVKQ